MVGWPLDENKYLTIEYACMRHNFEQYIMVRAVASNRQTEALTWVIFFLFVVHSRQKRT